MIALDFTLRDPFGYLAPSDLPNLTYADVAIELFQGDVIFIVNGVDLSMLRWIPLVHFAWQMFAEACALGPDHKEAKFGAAEVPPRWTFRLSNSCVLISRDDIAAVGKCGQAELIKATAEFGIRVYRALRDTLPAAAECDFLSNQYPYDRMEQCM
jgi:hypothetical protein